MDFSFKLFLVVSLCSLYLPSLYLGQNTPIVTANNTNCSFQTATITINNVTTFIQYQACNNSNNTLNVTDKYVFNIQMFTAYEVVNVQNENRNSAPGNTNNNNNNIVFSQKNPFNQTNTNQTVGLLNNNYNGRRGDLTNDNNNNIILGLTNSSNARVQIDNNNDDGSQRGGFGTNGLRGTRFNGMGGFGGSNGFFGRSFGSPYGKINNWRRTTTSSPSNTTTTTRSPRFNRFNRRFGGPFGPWFGKK